MTMQKTSVEQHDRSSFINLRSYQVSCAVPVWCPTSILQMSFAERCCTPEPQGAAPRLQPARVVITSGCVDSTVPRSRSGLGVTLRMGALLSFMRSTRVVPTGVSTGVVASGVSKRAVPSGVSTYTRVVPTGRSTRIVPIGRTYEGCAY